MSSGSILDGILPELIQYLSVPNIRPHLKQAQLLTDDEYQRLEITPSNTTQDAVEKLVKFLKRKGPKHEQLFLQALQRSMASDCHLGHRHIIALLEQGIPAGNSTPDNDDLAQSNGQSCYQDSPIASSNRDERSRSESVLLPQNGTAVNGLEVQYRGMCLQETVPSTLDSRAPLELAKFDYLEGSRREKREIQNLRCKVARDSENITVRFAKFVLAVYRLLESKQVKVCEVRLALYFLGCYKTVAPGKENVPIFGSLSDINQAEDLAKLIECLRNYSSWFNYHLLKFIAEEFGSEEGKALVADYEDDLAKYFENVIAYLCPEFSLVKGIPPGFQQLDIKVDWDFKSCRAQDIVLFQAKLSELLELEPHVFQLKSIEEGCVSMTWLVPSLLVPYIISEVRLHKCKLEEMCVLNIQAMGKHVGISTEKSHRIHRKHRDSMPSPKPKPLTPMTSNSSTVSTNSSHVSSLSELTPSPSKKSTCSNSVDDLLSNRSSRGSTMVDFNSMPVNAVEFEILSVYSGVSGTRSNSNSSSPSVTASKESLVQHSTSGSMTPTYSPHPASTTYRPNPLPQFSRSCQSVDNLLAISPQLSTPTRREVRAMSHCEGTRVSPDKQEAKSPDRNNRLKGEKGRSNPQDSPMKRLRRFLKKRVLSDGSIEVGQHSGSEHSFPILNLSEEPWRQRDFSAMTADFPPCGGKVPETLFQLPIVSLSRDESIRTLHANELTSEYSIHGRQSKGRLSVPSVSSGYVSESPTRSASPSSITTPTFQHLLSEESAVLSESLDQSEYRDLLQPRRRSNSAPNKILQDVRRPAYSSTNYDSLPRRQKLHSVHVTTGGIISLPSRPTSSPSTSSNPSRVTSPSSGSRRTSDYFSDFTSLSGPSSPPSMVGSEFPSEESVCTIVSQPGQPTQQRPYKPPLRTHSLTYRSHNATQASPLVKSHMSQSHSSHFH